MTAPQHHAAPLLTLEDIERVAGIVWKWIADQALRLLVALRAAVGPTIEDWQELHDPRDEYARDFTDDGRLAFALAVMRQRSQHSGQFPIQVLESSLLRPQVMAGLGVSL